MSVFLIKKCDFLNLYASFFPRSFTTRSPDIESVHMNTVEFCPYMWYNPIVMIKKTIPILLIGMICVGSISGLFTVTCYGADGHVAVEPVTHNHCDCPETDGTSNDKSGIGLSDDHEHCTDSITTSNILSPNRKNSTSFPDKISALSCVLKSIAPFTPSVLGFYAIHRFDFSSFHTPLQTIILLA